MDRAVNEYDERLSFGWHEQNQDWVVFMKMPHKESFPNQPILGFGNTVPTPEKAVQRLREADTLRTGESIINDMNRRNAGLKAAIQSKAGEATEDAAERIDSANRKHGFLDKNKFFVSGVS